MMMLTVSVKMLFNSPDRQIKICADPISQWGSSHIWYIPVYFLVGSTREVPNGIRYKYTSQMIILFCYWIYLKLAASIYRYSLPICPMLFMEVWFQAVIYKPIICLLELPCLFQFVAVDTVLLNWSRWTSSICKFWKRKKPRSSQTKSHFVIGLTILCIPHTKILSLLTKWTWHTETEDYSLLHGWVHNLHLCNVLTFDSSLLW